MKKAAGTALLLTLLAILAGSASAGDAGRESLFSIGAGARPVGMGGGFTSIADDGWAVYYNPAALPGLEYHQVSFMHTDLFEGTIYDCASWAYPVAGVGGFGVGYMRIGTGDITRTRNFVDVGEFDYSTSQFLFSYGRELEGGFSAGFSLKIVNQSIDNMSDYGAGLDMGLRSRISKHVFAGMMVRDMIPATIKLQSTEEHMPTSLVVGLGCRSLEVFSRAKLSGSFEVDKVESRRVKIHTGLEAVFNDAYALRAGFDRDNLTLGLGFVHHRLKVDYAYKVMDYIEDSHRFSLSLLIGSSVTEQLRRREAEAQKVGTALLEDERHNKLKLFRETADAFYNQFRLDSALVYYYRALAFDESNREIIGTIAAIKNALEVQQEQRKKLEQTQTEMENMKQNFYQQATRLFGRRHYSAALDILQLIYDIDSSDLQARTLEKEIRDAVAGEIVANLESGRKAEKEGRYLEAIEDYNRVLELDPSNVEMQQAKRRLGANLDVAQQLNTGIELYRASRYDEARKHFAAVLSVNPDEPVALEYMRRIDKFLAEPTSLEDLQKDKEYWQLYLEGLRHMRNKEYQEAVDVWEKVLEAYPNNQSTRDNLEQARLRLQSEKSK
jgi:tetratricopeptide (TPR) repeat protein